jgi:hypothetical protein
MKLHVDGKTYDYDQDRMTNIEAMAIEKVTGLTFAEWAEALTNGSMLATTALVWVVQKRDEPTIKFSEVEFELARLELDDDPDSAGDGGKDDAPGSGDPVG